MEGGARKSDSPNLKKKKKKIFFCYCFDLGRGD